MSKTTSSVNRGHLKNQQTHKPTKTQQILDLKNPVNALLHVIGNFNSRQKGEAPNLKIDLLILATQRRKNEKVQEWVPGPDGNIGHSGNHLLPGHTESAATQGTITSDRNPN